MEKLLPQLRFPEFKGEWEHEKLSKFSTFNPKNNSLPISFVYIDLESVTNGLLVKENIINKDVAPSRAQRILVKEDILFQTVRPYQQNNLFFNKDGDYVASTGYAQIRTKNDRQFLFQFLHTEKFVAEVMLRCTGTSYPAINSVALSEIGISFPSLPEQTKIATFLTAVDEKLTALKQKKTLLEQYKKGVMQQIFSQELRFKDDNGNDFADWEEKKLGDCLDYIQPTKYLVLSTEYDKSYKTPVLTAGKTFILGYTDEVNGIYTDGLPIIIFDDFTTATQFVNFPFKAKSSAMKILKVKEGVNIRFMYEAMQIMKYELGGHERHWISKFAPMEIAIPSLEEQTRIANFLSSIDVKINHCKEQIDQTTIWKKGLLQQLFV
jgi:type I restriction enzyme S subunit